MSELDSKNKFRKLLSHQAVSLKDARDWFIATKLKSSFESVLEVGCGFGDVLHEIGKKKYAIGIDIDQDFLSELRVDGVRADAHLLPFKDSSFDLVFCHFSLMWFSDPVTVLREMARVTNKWICCMAEFDYGARVDFPDEFKFIRDKLAEGIKQDGGDPYIGRKLYKYFKDAGLQVEVGAYSHVLTPKQLKDGFDDEWEYIQEFTDIDDIDLKKLRKNELLAINAGIRFVFTPVFYALSKKP